MKKALFCFIAVWMCLLLFGCDMRTVDEMYALPARPAADHNLEQVINEAMTGLDYCAPKAGNNQQIVQMADLDGNNEMECIVFAKGDDIHPLKIMIFDKKKDTYCLVDTISFNGSAFDQVEFAQIDGKSGVEIVVGRQLNDRVVRSVSVYSFRPGHFEQLLNTDYSNFIVADLDEDGLQELFITRPGSLVSDHGVAELFEVKVDTMERSVEVPLSAPEDGIRQITVSGLQDKQTAIYVSTAYGENALITDVLTVKNGELCKLANPTPVETIRNYYVYAQDIDNDGIMELPFLVDMVSVTQSSQAAINKLIGWYSLDSSGVQTIKTYTYHNYIESWYLEIQPQWVNVITAAKQDNEYDFFLWDRQYRVPMRMFSIVAHTGHNREELAQQTGSVILLKLDSIIYAATITETGEKHGVTAEGLRKSFHKIWQDWKEDERLGVS